MLRRYASSVLMMVGFTAAAWAQRPATRPALVARPGVATAALTLDVEPVGPIHEIPLASVGFLTLTSKSSCTEPGYSRAVERKLLPQGETLVYEGEALPQGTRLLSRPWGGGGWAPCVSDPGVYALIPLVPNLVAGSLSLLRRPGPQTATRQRASRVRQRPTQAPAQQPAEARCIASGASQTPEPPTVTDLACISGKVDSASVRIDATRRIVFVRTGDGYTNLELWNGTQLEQALGHDVTLVRDGAGRYWLLREL